jgi:hypothetical protein
VQISEKYKFKNPHDSARCTIKPTDKIENLYSLEISILSFEQAKIIFDSYINIENPTRQELSKIIYNNQKQISNDLSRENSDLKTLIDQYLASEIIEKVDCGNKYYVDVEKSKTIHHYPPWLIISIKIFLNDPYNIGLLFKLTNKNNIPEKLFGGKYEIKAISAHSGQINILFDGTYKNKSSGHYVAYIKMNDKWNVYNDDRVTQFNTLKSIFEDSTYKYFTPYILFYKRIK